MTPNQDHITGFQQGYHLWRRDALKLLDEAIAMKKNRKAYVEEGVRKNETTDRLAAGNLGYEEWVPDAQFQKDNMICAAIVFAWLIGIFMGGVMI